MASKLHRRGLTDNDAATWEPPAKNGVTVVRSGREPGAQAFQQGSADSDAHFRELEKQMNERVQSAYQRGLQEGEAGGRQQAEAQFRPALERMARCVEEIAATKPRLRHEAEDDVVKLALAIARRILYREIATDAAALLGLVRSALDRLDGKSIHRVRANSLDASVLQQYFQQMTLPVKIEVFADAALQRGSVIFETGQGSFDASVDTQLNEIERGFADLVRRAK